MQINLDEKEIYYTGDLNRQQFEVLLSWLKKNDTGWEDTNIEDIQNLNGYDSLKYSDDSWWWELNEKQTKNAKELFYTLENIQVDCRELTEEQIKEMADVFEKAGYEKWDDADALKIENSFVYLSVDWVNEFYITGESHTKQTITYEKFMELFSELNKWYKYDDGSLFYVTSECKKGHLYGYGFNREGSWEDYTYEGGHECAFNNVAKNYKTPATKEEVEERLKQEAIKRGFIKGVEVGCLNEGGYISEIEEEDYYLDKECDEVFWNTFCVDSSAIMKDGVWLEIENEKLPPYKNAPLKWNYETLVGDVIETTDEVSPISSREKELKKTLKYLLKKDIILTPKQYKKLWKKP